MTDRVDFFISYNSNDKEWAQWIAYQLEDEEVGYTTRIQEWDFVPGSNFVLEMQEAASIADRTIIVLSQNYLDAEYTQPEWAAAFVQDPRGKKRMLIPVRISACEPDGLLSAIRYIDLVGLDAETAKQTLLTQVKVGRLKPLTPPPFPGPTKNQLSASFEFGTHSVESWRQERVKAIMDNRYLTPMMSGASVILHLAPLVRCEPELSNEVLKGYGRELKPLYSSGWNHEFNHYGHLTFNQRWTEEVSHSYTQFYRTGEVEAVDKALLMPRKDFGNAHFIPSTALEKDIMATTKMYLTTMKNAGIELPIVVSLSFAQIHGYSLAVGSATLSRSTEEDNLLLPSVVIHQWDEDIPVALKPTFDRLWNVFGYEGSQNYKNGIWIPNV